MPPADHRTPAHVDFAAVWLGEIPGAVSAVRAGAVKTDPGSGGAIAHRQRRVARSEGRGIDAGRIGSRGGFAGSDRAAVPLALPQGRTVSAEQRIAHIAVVPANAGATLRKTYFPIASAIRPSVPTMTRHQANSLKPWRVAELRKVFINQNPVPDATQKAIAV